MKLEPMQQKLLDILSGRFNKSCSHSYIIEEMWPDPDFEPDFAKTQTGLYVVKIRKKLPEHLKIITKWGYGYMLTVTGDAT